MKNEPVYIILSWVYKLISGNPTDPNDKQERAFIMLKPDAVQRNLVGKIIERFEAKGLKLVALKFIRVTNPNWGHDGNFM